MKRNIQLKKLKVIAKSILNYNFVIIDIVNKTEKMYNYSKTYK